MVERLKMKLTKKQKEKLIGKKIIVDHILVKENEWPVDDSIYITKSLRKTKTEKLKEPVKAVIVGFTHLCEGKFHYDGDAMDFICTKRIPCIKIASGVIGKIQHTPMRLNINTLLSVVGKMKKKETLVDCPVCGGDGKETCTNPDHGFISGMGGFEVSRLGCPVCGHDPEHKVPNGGGCDFCNGTGEVTEKKAEELEA